MSIITTRALTRSFGPVTAVDRLSLDLPEGGVVGLVGPNGSGKSTLIRMLLGLVRPSSGSAEVLGEPISRPARFADRVGSLIEGPAFLPALSARANLVSLARLRGLRPPRVDEVLETVGLRGREHEPVRNFSLGMKQRLGIAAALLPDPELLILDEPTNGLDPAGIVEVRGLLRSLGGDGRTVIVSSHLLGEIQAACDHLVVVAFGELVFSGPLTELLARASEYIELAPESADDEGRLRLLLEADGWEAVPTDGMLRVEAPAQVAAQVNRVASAGGVTLRVLTPRQDDLEDVFLRMTGADDGALAGRREAQASGGRRTRRGLRRREVAR